MIKFQSQDLLNAFLILRYDLIRFKSQKKDTNKKVDFQMNPKLS